MHTTCFKHKKKTAFTPRNVFFVILRNNYVYNRSQHHLFDFVMETWSVIRKGGTEILCVEWDEFNTSILDFILSNLEEFDKFIELFSIFINLILKFLNFVCRCTVLILMFII
jgi:hypothetical protein